VSWTVLVGMVIVLGLALLATLSRRTELRRMQHQIQERDRAVRAGSAKAQLQHPVIDLSRCLGCGACVRACPEDGVLELVHGQAVVVNGSRCAGVSACARECPVGAITVTLTDLEQRRDIPVLTEELEAVGSPGLFLAGEVTAHALIKTAIEHGMAVASEVARRRGAGARAPAGAVDLCIVGAGPAGLACALEAKRLGLSSVVLDQASEPGGTIAKYPRRKLVLTRPVELPLAGKLARESYSKEELMELWQRIARDEDLPLRFGEVFQTVDREADGSFVVRTATGEYRARHVCLALGRRGTPRKLDVPGEELPKVAYSLMDAGSFRDRRVLVVGGGDTAVEAAIGLAEQPGNDVTLSYRQESFFRLRSRNEAKLLAAVERKKLTVLMRSRVTSIRADAVDLEVANASGSALATLPNDDVFVMAGGILPLEVLEKSGVSFDPALRPAADPIVEQGSGFVSALATGVFLALAALGWALWNADYYALPADARPVHAKHLALRPGQGLGLALGTAACVLILFNLAYLVRRERKLGVTFGSLQGWMTLHVATGILALLCATLHSGMDARNTVGGHALWALVALLVTGAIGRYFYAYVPRAANGRELDVGEVKHRVARLVDTLDASQRAFVERVQTAVHDLIEARQWRSSFLGRVAGLFVGQRELRRVLVALEREGRVQHVPEERLQETIALARQAHRAALMAAHYEDLRALLNAWRYLHRWVAALMILLIVLHLVFAFSYGSTPRLGGIR
jgi:thioredoxin reductase/Pyruvate/2-oxoacid:ferredoxin oxidoreductase delta subunit